MRPSLARGLRLRRSSNVSTNMGDLNDAAQRVSELADTLALYHRRYDAIRDSRAVFAYTYFNITHDLANRLAAPQSDFNDLDWVADLAVEFGTRYMAAMDTIDDWERSQPSGRTTVESLYQTVPRPWADVYQTICLQPSTVLEDLVYSMGAHITYDLPYALLAVGTVTDRLSDYHRMNDVLASKTSDIQKIVTDRYNRYLAYFDRVLGEGDEVFTNYWIRLGRSIAWYNAMRLQSPHSRTQAEGSIERSTYYLIQSVRTNGPWPLRWGGRLYRTLFSLKREWPTPPVEPAGQSETWKSRW